MMDASKARNVKKVATLCLVISLYLLFYHATLDDYFFFEDFIYLERSKIHSLKEIPSLFSVEVSSRGFGEDLRFYRPLSSNFYFGMLQWLFGLNYYCFHAANLSFLALNAYLFWRRGIRHHHFCYIVTNVPLQHYYKDTR